MTLLVKKGLNEIEEHPRLTIPLHLAKIIAKMRGSKEKKHPIGVLSVENLQ